MSVDFIMGIALGFVIGTVWGAISYAYEDYKEKRLNGRNV